MSDDKKWVQDWLKKGDKDLLVARLAIQTDEDLSDIALFHCQQCAEKYLKAFLILHGKPITKTHDLVKLIHECSEFDNRFMTFEEYAHDLTAYAVASRYPDDSVEYSESIAKESLNYVLKLREFILENIG